MKKGKLWAIVVLCSFFTQQIFAFTWETVGPNIDIIEVNVNIETIEILEVDEIIPEIEIVETIIEEEWLDDSEIFWSWNTLEDEQGILEDIDDEDWVVDIAEVIDIEEIVIEDENDYMTWTWVQEEVIIDNLEEWDFNFWIKFQNPSYVLNKDIEKEEYICDSDKDECKVNIVLTDNEWDNLWNDYDCFIEYSQSFENDNRCNPTTIILIEDTIIDYTVYLKDNPENIIQKSLVFMVENTQWEDSSWEEINNEELEENIEESLENNEEEESWTGENVNNQNIESLTGTWEESWTWIIVDSIEENILDEIDEIFLLATILLDIQSWLEYSWSGNIYKCEKLDCKINLDISESFSWSFLESDFICEWNFGSGSFTTNNTNKKCNPGYVSYGSWIHEISAKIISKNNSESFIWSNWIIHNIINHEETINKEIEWADMNEIIIIDTIVLSIENQETWTGFTQSWTVNNEWNTASWLITWTWDIVAEVFMFPEIYIEIQSGWEYIDNGTIKCDKQDCKLNLDVSEIFNEEFLEKNYICSWNFWSGTFSSQNTVNKCNPWYVDYVIWDDIIKLKLFEKDNLENYIEKNIYIINEKIVPKTSSTGWSAESSDNISSQKDYEKITVEKNIIIQSWLENNNCDSELCKINLDYENTSYESCRWNFWNIETTEKYKTTCNPWFIYAEKWIQKIILEIYNSKTNKKYSKELVFYNNFTEIENYEAPIFNIILQWKELDYKKYYNNKIVCLWVDKCSINLNLETNTKSNLEYSWNFWNWEISNSQNPKSVWFSSGSHELILNISWDNINETKTLLVEVTWNEIWLEQKNIVEEFKFKEDKENSLFTQLKQININNIELWLSDKKSILTKDIYEKSLDKITEIWWFHDNSYSDKKLKLTRNISQQKKSLKYSWITFPNSHIYILQWDDIIELSSDNDGKYSQKFTNIKPGNFDLEYYVLDSQWNLFENKKEKLLTLTHDYVADLKDFNLNITKNKQKKINKSSDKNVDKVKQKNIDNIQYASIIPEIKLKTSIWEYIFQLLLLLLSLLGGTVLLRKYKIL
jgi:hypothetical protein